MVRSLNGVKEELRRLTVRVDGQEQTVVGLVQTGRSLFYLIWRAHRTNHSLTTSSIQTFHSWLFFPYHTSPGAWKCLLCSTGKGHLCSPIWMNIRNKKKNSKWPLTQNAPTYIHSTFLRCFWAGVQQETLNSWQSSSPPRTQPLIWSLRYCVQAPSKYDSSSRKFVFLLTLH